MNYFSTLPCPKQQRSTYLQTASYSTQSLTINDNNDDKKNPTEQSPIHTLKLTRTSNNTKDLSPRSTINIISNQINNHAATTKNKSIDDFNDALSNEEQLHDKFSTLLMTIQPHLNNCNNKQLFKKLYKNNSNFKQAIDHFSSEVYPDFKKVTSHSLAAVESLRLTTTIPHLQRLPESLKCYIKHKAYKKIQQSHRYTYANEEGIDCCSFCPSTAMIAIGDRQFGLLLRSLSIVCNKTLIKQTPKSVCFNHDGSRIAALISNLTNNISSICEWDTQSYQLTNGLTIENNCHHISYYTHPNHILRVIADTNSNCKSYMQYHVSLFDGHTPAVEEISASEYKKTTQWNDINCKQYHHKNDSINITRDSNNVVITTTFEKRNARHFYLCSEAIQNTQNKNDLPAIKETRMYKALTDYEKASINKKIEEKTTTIDKNF